MKNELNHHETINYIELPAKDFQATKNFFNQVFDWSFIDYGEEYTAFSNGSLLFGFIQRIMKKQPLSSPLDVKRYFVSPIESGELCMLASLLGESGDIFFPKLSEETRALNL